MKLKQIKYIGLLVSCNLATNAFGIINLKDIDKSFLDCKNSKIVTSLGTEQTLTKEQIRALCLSGTGGFKITNASGWTKTALLSKNITDHVLKLFYTCHIFLQLNPTTQQKEFLEKIAHNVLYSYLSLVFSDTYKLADAQKGIKESSSLATTVAKDILYTASDVTKRDACAQKAATELNNYDDSKKYKWKGHIIITQENKKKLSETLKEIKESFKENKVWLRDEEKEDINAQIEALETKLNKGKITQKEGEEIQRTIKALNEKITGLKNDQVQDWKRAKQGQLDAITTRVDGKKYITDNEEYKNLVKSLENDVANPALSKLNEYTVKNLNTKIAAWEQAERDRLAKSVKKVKGSDILNNMSPMQKKTMGRLIEESKDYTEEDINNIPNKKQALVNLFNNLLGK